MTTAENKTKKQALEETPAKPSTSLEHLLLALKYPENFAEPQAFPEGFPEPRFVSYLEAFRALADGKMQGSVLSGDKSNSGDFSSEFSCGEYIVIGVDEAGRGPLFGPVACAAACLGMVEILDESASGTKTQQAKVAKFLSGIPLLNPQVPASQLPISQLPTSQQPTSQQPTSQELTRQDQALPAAGSSAATLAETAAAATPAQTSQPATTTKAAQTPKPTNSSKSPKDTPVELTKLTLPHPYAKPTHTLAQLGLGYRLKLTAETTARSQEAIITQYFLSQNDSKMLTDAKRRVIFDYLRTQEAVWAVEFGSVEEIDRLNILSCTKQTMRKAVASVIAQLKARLLTYLGQFVPELAAYPTGETSGVSIGVSEDATHAYASALKVSLEQAYPQLVARAEQALSALDSAETSTETSAKTSTETSAQAHNQAQAGAEALLCKLVAFWQNKQQPLTADFDLLDQYLYAKIIVCIDGNQLIYPADAPVKQAVLVSGDARLKEISVASILAKVARDLVVEEVAQREGFNRYGLDKHKGYLTAAHKQALFTYGPTSQHRQSFKPIPEALALGHPVPFFAPADLDAVQRQYQHPDQLATAQLVKL